MKWVLIAIAVCFALLYWFGRRPMETAVLLVYHNGREYEILDRGDLLEEDKPTRFIRYYSKAPFNATVRAREQRDLLAIVAKHINTNMHQRVVITAVEKDPRYFGLVKPREYISILTTEEVLKHGAADQSGSAKRKRS